MFGKKGKETLLDLIIKGKSRISVKFPVGCGDGNMRKRFPKDNCLPPSLLL